MTNNVLTSLKIDSSRIARLCPSCQASLSAPPGSATGRNKCRNKNTHHLTCHFSAAPHRREMDGTMEVSTRRLLPPRRPPDEVERRRWRPLQPGPPPPLSTRRLLPTGAAAPLDALVRPRSPRETRACASRAGI